MNPTTPLPMQLPQPGSSPLNTPPAPTLQLADIHLPDPVPFWPLAPGWWLLLIGLIAITAGALWFFHTQRSPNSWLTKRQIRREASLAIENAYAHWQSHRDHVHYCTELNHVLKRYCRYAYAHQPHIMSLSGQNWMDFLEASSAVRFSPDQRQALAERLYQKTDEHRHQTSKTTAEPLAEALRETCLQWLATHTTVLNDRSDNPVTGDQ